MAICACTTVLFGTSYLLPSGGGTWGQTVPWPCGLPARSEARCLRTFYNCSWVLAGGLWMPADETTKLTKGFAFVEYLQPEVGSCLAALWPAGCKLLPPSPLLSTSASVWLGYHVTPPASLLPRASHPGSTLAGRPMPAHTFCNIAATLGACSASRPPALTACMHACQHSCRKPMPSASCGPG